MFDKLNRVFRTGDRFWYEEETSGFSLPQLEAVRQSSLARVLCDNSDDVSVIQPRVFHVPDVNNIRVSCDQLPEIDMSLWQE